MSKEPRLEPDLADSLTDQAARSTLELNPLVGLRSEDLFNATATLVKAVTYDPTTAVKQWLWFVGELGKIVTGQSERAPQAGDRRFADPAWKSSNLHRSLLQGSWWLHWGDWLRARSDEEIPAPTALGNARHRAAEPAPGTYVFEQ